MRPTRTSCRTSRIQYNATQPTKDGRESFDEPQPPPHLPKGRPTPDENEGEGSRTAARHYDEATREYVESGRVDQAAKEAERAYESEEGDELREAEREGRTTEPEPEPGDPLIRH